MEAFPRQNIAAQEMVIFFFGMFIFIPFHPGGENVFQTSDKLFVSLNNLCFCCWNAQSLTFCLY